MSLARLLVPLGASLALMMVAPQSPQAGRGVASRSVVLGAHGMVCASQPLAVQAGIDVLRRGGSAVDAAIAVNACLGLMEPTANGLGGDLFAIVWDPKTRRLHGLNASGRAPRALTAEQVPAEKDGTVPLYSPYAWTVPGCADGWFELHARFGKLAMKEVLAPAARYAEEGFPVSPVIAENWAAGVKRFGDKPGFREVFMPGGKTPAEGEIFRNPALAKTLRLLGDKGRDAYYRGPIAEALVRFSKAHHGFFSLEDFAAHRTTWDEPISTTYRGYEVWELPPNGQGLAALQMLNLIEGHDLKAMGRESADFWHLLVEAKKIAFADRARYYADPAFVEVPVKSLLSKDYAKQRAMAIDMTKAALTDSPGDLAAINRGGTTYLCTADENGMMVSLIQSNYTGFGSGYVVPDLGFGIQNRGGCFALKPGHPNRLEPGKRPFHTIIPAFVTQDGEPRMAFGLMGGDMQPQGHVQALVNLFDLGMNLQEAGDAIRFHHTDSTEPMGTVMTDGGILHIEDGLPQAVLDELERRGHRLEAEAVGAYGGYQAIWRAKNGVYSGATERRKDGCAMGY